MLVGRRKPLAAKAFESVGHHLAARRRQPNSCQIFVQFQTGGFHARSRHRPHKLQSFASGQTQSALDFTIGDNSSEVRIGQLERKLSRTAPR